MSWHYGIVKQKTSIGVEYFSLHEIYTDPDGRTEDAVGFMGATREELIEALEMALADARKWPVKDETNE